MKRKFLNNQLFIITVMLMILIFINAIFNFEINTRAGSEPIEFLLSTRNPDINSNTKVIFETNYGNITIELYDNKAPKTVENFLKYVNDKFYDGLIFHRVIDGFVIQGGGFYPNMTQKTATYPPIQLEIAPELKHVDGAIAMARTSDPDSATSQFFINDGPQPNLEPGGVDQYGYAVFGQVVAGMDVVREISAVATQTEGYYNDVPVEDVIIQKVYTVIDTDGDGYFDSVDAFPNDPAASQDTDGDGYPDAWIAGMSESDSTTGLKIDEFPSDPKRWGVKSTDTKDKDNGFLPGFELIFLLIAIGILFIINNKQIRIQ